MKKTKTIPLYDLPEGTKLKLPIYSMDTDKTVEEICTFGHIDGMYSYITVDSINQVVHLGAVTPMVKNGDYYEIAAE